MRIRLPKWDRKIIEANIERHPIISLAFILRAVLEKGEDKVETVTPASIEKAPNPES